MNITYIIGNGFDLNLGFPTDYSHFYDYYCSVPSSSKNIESLKEDIKQYKNNDWVDLELGLGKYTSKVPNSNVFQEAYLDLNCQLSRYMTAVNELIKTNMSDSLKEKIINDLRFPESSLPDELEETINQYRRSVIRSSGNSSTIINILSFNYTHTIEYLELNKTIDFKNEYTTFKNGYLKHIHRAIGDNGVWLGVDNDLQIQNEPFRNDRLIRQLLIKPYDITSSGSGLMNQATAIIESSDLICVFGSSMGFTDLTWWRMIGDRLFNSNCRMIYFTIDKVGFITDHMMLYKQNTIRTDLTQKLTGISDRMNSLDDPSKIFVQINTDLFRDKDYSSEINNNYKAVRKLLDNK